ncbi:MAG TPA: PAS domain S-box protein [Thermodesulfobacteriota bacterium]|nr:PAS domain S-box protein [Thermodesulfobacteriota bacterium]
MKKKLYLINVEDNPNDAELNKAVLEEDGFDCELVCVETREAFINVLQTGGGDIILADNALPNFDGLSALNLAREYSPETPFLFVSGTLGEEVAVEALKNGATDYIIKDRLERLPSAVRRALDEKEARTKRRQAEEALAENEKTLKSIFRAAPVGIGVVVERIILEANEMMCDMLGYSRAELIGQSSRLVYPDDAEFNRVGTEKYRQIKESGIGTVETRWQRKNGTIIDVLLSSSPIDPDNLSTGVTFTALNITNRKKAEEALRRSESRLSKLMAQNFDIIYETDEFGFIKSISPQSEQVFGLKPEFLKGKHFQEFLKDSERERVLNWFHHTMNNEGFGTLEFLGKKQDGSEVHCELRHIFQEEEGQVNGTIGVIRDLSERYKMQAHLQQSQKMEAIGTLAGGIAHDFNNILGAIIGYTQLALYDLPEDSKLKYNFDQVLKASDRARDLVKQILSFSRQTPQEQGPIHILPVLKEGLKLLRASLPKSIEIRYNLSIKDDSIIGDPTQIHQVIMNLCTNAAQAIGGKQGVLEINLEELVLSLEDLETYPGLKEGPYLRLSVRDTGSGIEPAILSRIFDPFFTTKAPGVGTGMGLSVVHGIVKSHRGEITVYSELGVGTTFRVYLPLIRRIPALEEASKDPLPRGKEKILFIDDEPQMVESWMEMLGRLGYQVFGRTSSLNALDLFKNAPDKFDLVITDQTMPGMSGSELAAKMLAIRPGLPIIICSGYSESLGADQARGLGVQKFLMKPVLLGEMALNIRKVLDGNG